MTSASSFASSMSSSGVRAVRASAAVIVTGRLSQDTRDVSMLDGRT